MYEYNRPFWLQRCVLRYTDNYKIQIEGEHFVVIGQLRLFLYRYDLVAGQP